MLETVVRKNKDKTDDEIPRWYQTYLRQSKCKGLVLSESEHYFRITSPRWQLLFRCKFEGHTTAALVLHFDYSKELPRKDLEELSLSVYAAVPTPLAKTFAALPECPLSRHVTNSMPALCKLDRFDAAAGDDIYYKYRFEYSDEGLVWLEVDGSDPVVRQLLENTGIPLVPCCRDTRMTIVAN